MNTSKNLVSIRSFAVILAALIVATLAMRREPPRRGVSAAWEELPPLAHARQDHTVTTMPDGTVVVVGGRDADGRPLPSIEVLTPGASAWREVGQLAYARADHTATRMPDGRLLIAGGQGAQTILSSSEIFDPATDAISVGPALVRARRRHTAVLVSTGELWLVGGDEHMHTISVERLPARGADFVDAGTLDGVHAAWAGRSGVVVARTRFRPWFPGWSKWFPSGRWQPPVLDEVTSGATRSIAHRLPRASSIAAMSVAGGAIVITRSPAVRAWRYDTAKDALTEVASPPRGAVLGWLAAIDGTAGVVSVGEGSALQFDGREWSALPAPPVGFFEFVPAATASALVIVGGIDRATGSPTARAWRLRFPATR